MKNLIFTLFALILAFSTVGQKDIFDEANEAYKDEKYENAIQLYDSILNDNQSFKVYYNLGNALLKTNEYPRALLNFEKAKKINPKNADLIHNIEYTKKLLNIDNKKNTKEISDLIDDVSTWKIYPLWQYLAILLLLVTCILIFLFFKMEERSFLRALFFYMSLMTLILTISCYYLSHRQYKTIYKVTSGIVIPFSIDVYGEPSKNSNEVFEINAGYKVKILSEVDEWYEIAINNGNIGWTLKENVAPISLLKDKD